MPLIASGVQINQLDQILNQLDKGRQPTKVVPCVFYHGKVMALALNIIRVIYCVYDRDIRRKYENIIHQRGQRVSISS